ncbi:MAG TPA: FHA domain-containing protein, partial [Steroidobacteraceae bacterium]|nr:FHA domain-containing protein [Steroidobacteraceae bacterium]
MHPFAIELDDRAVAFARDGQVSSIAPSAVWDGSTGQASGSNAWGALRKYPTATSTHHLGALLSQRTPSERTVGLVAAEWVRRLAADAPKSGESVWVGVPVRASQAGLGALLAIARSLSLPIDGFVDSAVATVAALGLERSAIVLELGLHHAAVTYVDHDGGQVRRRRTALSERGGLMSVYQGWLELVSTTMVKQTRFDPLHDAATEQQLFDSLAGWARAAAEENAVRAVLTQGAERFEVVLTSDQFAQAGQSVHREVVRLLHELRPAGAPLVLVLPAAVARLPGLQAGLEQFADCELLTVSDGFAAAAISRLDLPVRGNDDPVRLLRRLPLFETANAVEPLARGLLGPAAAANAAPSHLLLEGQVYSLSGPALVIGRAPVGPRTLTVSEGLAGVSRRHCTLATEGDELILVDHSVFGTFV